MQIKETPSFILINRCEKIVEWMRKDWDLLMIYSEKTEHGIYNDIILCQ